MHEWYKSTGIDPLPLRVTELTPPHLHKHTHQVLFWNIEKDWGRSGGGNPRTEGEERDSKRYDICNKNCSCPGSRRFYFESARKIPWEPEDFFSRTAGCFSVALWPTDRSSAEDRLTETRNRAWKVSGTQGTRNITSDDRLDCSRQTKANMRRKIPCPLLIPSHTLIQAS